VKFDPSARVPPGLGRELPLRIPPHGRTGRCYGLAHGGLPNQNQGIGNLSQREFDDSEAGEENRHGVKTGAHAREERVADERQAGTEKNRKR